MRAGLAEDPAVAPRTERAKDDVGSDAPPRPKRNHGRCRRHASVEVLGPGVARQDECSRREQRMSDVDVAASCEDGDLGCGRRSQALSELCVFRGCGRKDPVWPPGPSWACAKHSGADEHGVRERAQQTHHEPIRVAVPGDELVRARHRRNRNDAVDRRDEIGVHAVLGEPQIAVVESRELLRQRRVQKPVLFVQELERHEGLGCGHAREGTRTGLRRQAWKRSPSTTLSTALRSARNAIPTRSSSSDDTPATAARFASSWPVSKRSAV